MRTLKPLELVDIALLAVSMTGPREPAFNHTVFHYSFELLCSTRKFDYL
jgi:hypothetical protein